MASSSVSGASGLTATFLPVLQASLQRGDELNSVSQSVAQSTSQQIDQSITSAASPINDVASVALSGRGQNINITA